MFYLLCKYFTKNFYENQSKYNKGQLGHIIQLAFTIRRFDYNKNIWYNKRGDY